MGWRPGSRPPAGRTSPSPSRRQVRRPWPRSSRPNAFAAAPVRQSRANLAATSGDPRGGFGWAEAVVSTSGSANAATGAAGDADQAAVGRLVAEALGIDETHVLHLSTGVIGTRLPLDKVAAGLEALVPQLAADDAGLEATALALRTTDSVTKVATTTVDLPGPDGGGERRHHRHGHREGRRDDPPEHGHDAVGDPDRRRGRAGRAVGPAPAGGGAHLEPALGRWRHEHQRHGVRRWRPARTTTAEITPGSAAATALGAGIEAVARDLARQQAADGEGATILITAVVRGARDDADARAVARSIVSSSLVKAAAHGKDPNWGRIAGAAGNAVVATAGGPRGGRPRAPTEAATRAGQRASLDPDRLRISIAGHLVFDGAQGGPLDFDRAAARAAMDAPELVIELDLGLGDGTGEAFGCDLTEAYVIENSEYTT